MALLWRPRSQGQHHWDTLSEVHAPKGFLRHHHHHHQQHHQQQQQPGQAPVGGMRTVVDVKETPEAYQLFMDLPGMKQQEVIVRLETKGRLLCISGERSREAPGHAAAAAQQGDHHHHHHGGAGGGLGLGIGLFHRAASDRDACKFERRFHIPDNADLGAIRSSLVDGVLLVTVPKIEKPQELTDIDFA